jgi:hypothetical protein
MIAGSRNNKFNTPGRSPKGALIRNNARHEYGALGVYSGDLHFLKIHRGGVAAGGRL